MDEIATCGAGLAAQSQLHTRLAEVAAAMAEVLEQHIRALAPGDPAARPERDAYADLVARHRALAASLEGTARSMVGYRDLPMPAHDEAAMADAASVAAFGRYVRAKAALRAYLESGAEEEQQMLAEMERGG